MLRLGRRRRGFLHILEIIIVVLVAFALFVQFAVLPQVKNEWTEPRLSLLAEDVLRTLDLQGLNWFNSTAVSGNVTALLNNSGLRFDLRVLHAPKPTLRIGCYYCSESEVAFAAAALRSVRANGENISAAVENVSAFSADFDAIVTTTALLAPAQSELEAYLRADKGVVELRDFAASGDVDSLQNSLFGVQWNDSIALGTGPLGLANTSLLLGGWFTNLPQFQATFDQGSAAEWSVQSGTWTLLDNGTWDTDALSWSYASAGSDLQNYTVTANVTLLANHTQANESWAGVGARFGNGERYLLTVAWDGAVALWNATGTSRERIIDVLGPGGANATRPVRLALRLNGTNLTALVNGSALISVSHARLSSGTVTLEATGANATFDDVRVTGLSLPNLLGAEKINATGSGIAVLVQNGTSVPALIAVDGAVLGHGRTAWLTNGDEHAVRQLLKASVLWVAGEEAVVVPGTLGDTFVTVRRPKLLTADFAQPVEVQLRVGTIY